MCLGEICRVYLSNVSGEVVQAAADSAKEPVAGLAALVGIALQQTGVC